MKEKSIKPIELKEYEKSEDEKRKCYRYTSPEDIELSILSEGEIHSFGLIDYSPHGVSFGSTTSLNQGDSIKLILENHDEYELIILSGNQELKTEKYTEKFYKIRCQFDGPMDYDAWKEFLRWVERQANVIHS